MFIGYFIDCADIRFFPPGIGCAPKRAVRLRPRAGNMHHYYDGIMHVDMITDAPMITDAMRCGGIDVDVADAIANAPPSPPCRWIE